MKIFKNLKNLFTTVPIQQPLPSGQPSLPPLADRHNPTPLTRPSERVPFLESSDVVEEFSIPKVQVEDVNPCPASPSEPFVPTVELPLKSHPIQISEDENNQMLRDFLSKPTPPRPRDLAESKPQEDWEGEGWNWAEADGYSGGLPPRSGGGGSPSSGPEPSGGSNYQWYFLLMVVFYAGYHWAFQQYCIDFDKHLTEFEKEKEAQSVNSKGIGLSPRQKVDITYRLWDVLRGGGWLLGGLLAGGDLARRALNVTLLPPLRRLAEAIVPRLIQSVLGPLITIFGKVACVVFSPFSRLALFFGMMGAFFGADSTYSLTPLMEPAILWVQHLFLAPAGFSNQVIFLSKNLKIFCSTFFFGGAVVNVHFFKRNRNSRSFFLGIALGTVAVFILLDRRFVYVIVQKYIFPAFPFLEEAVARPLVQISTVFAAGVLVQSVQFPPVVSFFYTCLLVISGIWRIVLFS